MSETVLPPFDVDTITLVGEGLAVEQASGMDIRALASTTSGQLLLAVFLSLWRSSGKKPSWSELTDLQISGISFGSSQPEVDGSWSEIERLTIREVPYFAEFLRTGQVPRG